MTYAAKKYQVRKEARMEFRIVDTVRLGGEIVAWFLNGPRQSEVPGARFLRNVGSYNIHTA
jgi:hypothetical protein